MRQNEKYITILEKVLSFEQFKQTYGMSTRLTHKNKLKANHYVKNHKPYSFGYATVPNICEMCQYGI